MGASAGEEIDLRGPVVSLKVDGRRKHQLPVGTKEQIGRNRTVEHAVAVKGYNVFGRRKPIKVEIAHLVEQSARHVTWNLLVDNAPRKPRLFHMLWQRHCRCRFLAGIEYQNDVAQEGGPEQLKGWIQDLKLS